MKNSQFSSNITTFLLVNFLFALRHLNAQSNENNSTDGQPQEQLDKKVMDVSARIAATYGADFYTVESYVWAAVENEDEIGIPASVVIGIAVYESSFKSELFLHSGNPFGIKAGKEWKGPTYTKHDDGADTPFRVYISPEEAVLDFGQFVQARGWYKDALACSKSDYRCVVDGLKKTDSEPGYSTNPAWGDKVIEMVEKLGLQALSQ